MRYYDIQVLNDDGSIFAEWTSAPTLGLSPNSGPHASNNQGVSLPLGNPSNPADLGAQMVDLDIPLSQAGAPTSFAYVKIWGASIQQMGQAADFNGKSIKVFAGMMKGLPLATLAFNSGQTGGALSGKIWQAFGTWIGTSQWLEFIVANDGSSIDVNTGKPIQVNLTLTWAKDQKLADALLPALQTAFPSYKINIAISDALVAAEDDTSTWTTVQGLAQHVLQASQTIVKDTSYAGVSIAIVGTTAINVSDNTKPFTGTPKAIVFTDLIGQPTWIDPGTIQVTTTLRTDIGLQDHVTIPQTQVTVTEAAAQSPFRTSKLVFTGEYIVSEVRIVGNSRQADALAWVTTINCNPTFLADTTPGQAADNIGSGLKPPRIGG